MSTVWTIIGVAFVYAVAYCHGLIVGKGVWKKGKVPW